MEKQQIPKIIHYCWFGKNTKSELAQKCIDTWRKQLTDYEIIEWNESNCSFDENEFVRKAFKEKKWAFVSDYYRLKALNEYGGVYFDTDVKVIKKLDDLLIAESFMGFMVNCCIGTAVIGSRAQNIHIRNILEMYENTRFVERTVEGIEIDKTSEKLIVSEFHTNNFYINKYLTHKVEGFVANNKYQELDKITVYPKEKFEIGKLFGEYYTIHINTGSWKTNKPVSDVSNKIKNLFESQERLYDILQIIVRKKRYYKMNQSIAKIKF